MTTPKPDLTDLARRVGELTGPDREVDALICLAFGAVMEPAERDHFGHIKIPAWWTMPGASREAWPHRTTPWPLTASLDAVLALTMRVRPGWCSAIRIWPEGAEALISEDTADLWDPQPQGPVAATPALALLVALLASLSTDAGGSGDALGEGKRDA